MVRLAVALPDSSLSDEQTLRDKTIKVGQFARSFSIFRVQQVILYHDKLNPVRNDDRILLETLLEFLDTPQYLRKILYPLSPQLKYAGLLHPIKAPHHKPPQDPRKIRQGERRIAVLVRDKGKQYVDAGLGILIPFEGFGSDGEKMTIEFTSTFPHLAASRSTMDDRNYWGYRVKKGPSLSHVLGDKTWTVRLVASRGGVPFREMRDALEHRMSKAEAIVVVFGSPKRDASEILAAEGASLSKSELVINTFPKQATETVRLEEAVLGTLAILNASFDL